MNNLEGQILFASICAVILAGLGQLIIARIYRSKLLSLMQSGKNPDDSIVQTTYEIPPQQSLSNQTLLALHSQNKKALWHYRIVIVSITLILSLLITLFNIEDATPNEPFSLRRTTLLILAYSWLVIPGLGLLERWSHIRIIGLSILYTSLVAVLILLNSSEGSTLAGIMFWLYGQQLPTIILILLLTGPNTRTLGPYLVIVFFLLLSASLFGYQLLDHSIAENDSSSWIIDLVGLTNATFVFSLFGVLPWLIVFFPLRYMARHLANLYQNKFFSEPLYLFSSIWLILLLFQAIILSNGLGSFAYLLILSWLIIPLVFFIMRPFLTPAHHPSTLLLLRVFREDGGIGKLFDNVIERWRYSGNTVMISGKDLALRTLEPNELFGFLTGHLQESFIADNSQLQQEISKIDLHYDPDGRFRVNDFFCFDTTWKMVVNSLISKTDLVLMDLRDYHSKREGCSYELNIIANSPHLQKIIILFNSETDTVTAKHLLGNKMNKVIWVKDDHTKQSKLEQRTLDALLK